MSGTGDTRQVERRLERALSGEYEIRNLGKDPIFSRFAVTSPSGRTYEVAIRHLRERANSCSCPDFLTNLIGTCKHIEAVLVRIGRPARYHDTLPPTPPHPQLYLHYGEELGVRLIRPERVDPVMTDLFDRSFDLEGQFRGDAARDLSSFIEAARAVGRIDVASDVLDHLRRLREAALWDAERHRYLERLERGECLGVTRLALRPYQERGAVHLATARTAVLADEIGLGKTAQALGAAELLRREHGVKRVLVICPASARHHWAREVRRFTGEAATEIEGPPEVRSSRYALAAAYTLTSLDQIHRDLEMIRRLDPHVTILDEAERITSWRHRTAAAVKEIQSPFRWCLTGASLEDRLDDLYSVMQFVDQRVLGPLWMYNVRYSIFDGRKVLGHKNLPDLRRRLTRVRLRRLGAELSGQLPERLDTPRFVTLTREQQQAHDAARTDLAARLTGRPAAGPARNARDRIRRGLKSLLAACLSPRLTDDSVLTPSPKIEELVAFMPDLVAAGQRVVVVTGWIDLAREASRALETIGLDHGLVSGKNTLARREEMARRFREDPGCRILVTTDAGARGLDLREADLLVHLDLPWSSGQLEARLVPLRRSSRSRGRPSIWLVAAGTVEERLFDHVQEGRDTALKVELPVASREQPALPDLEADADLATLETLLARCAPRAVEPPVAGPAGPGPVPATGPAPGDPVRVGQQRFAPEALALRRAESKLRAARCLLEGGLPGEAVGPAFETMHLAAGLLLRDPDPDHTDPRELLARLYAGPVREGELSPSLAAGFSRARDLRELAHGGSAELVDLPVARAVLGDADQFLDLVLRVHRPAGAGGS